MKHVYFIRHGETEKNRRRIHQGPLEPLTEKGRAQVREVIELLKDKNIDTLISSSYTRATETAEMIAEAFNIPCTKTDSVRELAWPHTLHGKHHFSLHSLRYLFDLYRHRMDLLWDREGAENLAHIRERIRDARLLIESLPGENIAIVSHRIFMTMFTETVCYDKPLSLFKFIHGIFGARRIPNAGILHFTCEAEISGKKCNWFLEKTSF